ncbi:MAG: hypothetical protein ACXVAG_18485 [Vulcanimicrobiaceae bacterium]
MRNLVNVATKRKTLADGGRAEHVFRAGPQRYAWSVSNTGTIVTLIQSLLDEDIA